MQRSAGRDAPRSLSQATRPRKTAHTHVIKDVFLESEPSAFSEMIRTVLLGEFTWSRATTLFKSRTLERRGKAQSFVSLGHPFPISMGLCSAALTA